MHTKWYCKYYKYSKFEKSLEIWLSSVFRENKFSQIRLSQKFRGNSYSQNRPKFAKFAKVTSFEVESINYFEKYALLNGSFVVLAYNS